MDCKCLYIAATSQHVGKTTSTLGLIAFLRKKGHNVGYCKPLGQQYVDVGPSRVDKDAFLFADFMDFELTPHLHSPVILFPGATTTYLDTPEQYPLDNRILKASKILSQNHDIVIYEGTGHPGVGSVVDLSNAHVAKKLNAGVVMIVEAGIGSTIDLLELNLSLFRAENVPIVGVIINKCLPDKMDKIRHYVGKWLKQKNIDLMGILPYEEELGLPLMETICKAIKGKVLFHEESMGNRVEDIVGGSLIDRKELKNFRNLLLVVSTKRLGDSLNKLKQIARLEESDDSPLSGIIVTGEVDFSQEQLDFIHQHKVPVIKSYLDTYESVIKISRIEVKINTRTPWKVKKAISLFEKHVSLDSLKAYLPG